MFLSDLTCDFTSNITMSDNNEILPPAKKKNKTIRQQCQEDLFQFKELFSKEMDDKFSRIENLILAGSSSSTRPASSPPHQRPTPPSTSDHSFLPNQDPPQTSMTTNKTVGTANSTNIIHDSGAATETIRNPAVTARPASTSNVPPLDNTSNVAALTHNVNNNNPATWMLPRAINNPVPPPMAPHLPTSVNDFEYDQDLESRVNHILAATAHQLSANNGKPGIFPHRFVSRGPDRRRPAFNTLSLSEHVWGITRIIRDPKVPADLKPFMYNHIEDIMEDASQFEWASAVRPWSEEIFTRVSEDRLTWDNRPEIQLLRMSMARNPAAKILPSGDPIPRPPGQQVSTNPRQTYGQNSNNNDIMKGGPPCEMYNSQQGCSLQSGHFIRGKRMIHVCRYCLINTSASHPHPETACRNKLRSGQPHF